VSKAGFGNRMKAYELFVEEIIHSQFCLLIILWPSMNYSVGLDKNIRTWKTFLINSKERGVYLNIRLTNTPLLMVTALVGVPDKWLGTSRIPTIGTDLIPHP
jgi:hypothetical protein